MLASARGARGLEPKPDPEKTVFTSMMFEFCMEELSGDNRAHVLDLGLTRGQNVVFFAERVEKLYINDIVSPLGRELNQGLTPFQMWRKLQYPPGTFDAILLWDLLDHLDDEYLTPLVKICHELMKPGGQLLVISQGEKNPVPGVRSFAIHDDYKLTARGMPRLHLPFMIRQNRDILTLMRPFIELRIFVYREGMREFLFKKESEEPTVLRLND